VYEVLPEERAAICDFAVQYPKIGYRKLTWMMVDAAVACVGESTVYRVLSEADLLSRWKRSTASSGEYHFRPTAPNQQWHTDVMYVWIAARFYFLLSFVDAYSRYVVHHKLLIALNGESVATELAVALEANPDSQPRVVHDHGSEFVNRDAAASGIQRHRGTLQRHGARGKRQRLRWQLPASRGDHRPADPPLQRRALTCDSRLHGAGDLASRATGGSSNRACAANRCGPRASEDHQPAAIYPGGPEQ
jgi:transposase InsO family protein